MIKKAKHFIWIIFVIAYFCVSPCHAQHIDFLRLVNSPRAIGMGECSVNNIDQLSAIYNPGALGLFHMQRRFGIVIPNSTQILKEADYDLHLRSSSYSARLYGINLNKNKVNKFGTAISLSYSHIKLSYTSSTVPYSIYGPLKYYYNSHQFTVALGVKYYLNFGIGLTLKKQYFEEKPYSDFMKPGDENQFDYGFILEAPVGKLINHFFKFDISQIGKVGIEINASYAFFKPEKYNSSMNYFGDTTDYAYLFSTSNNNTNFDRSGYSIKGDIEYANNHLLSIAITGEIENFLANRRIYGPPPHDYNSLGTDYYFWVGNDKIKKRGYELGLGNFVFFRWGKYKIYTGNISVSTVGLGINLSAMFKWLKPKDKNIKGKLLRYLYNNLDIRFDMAKYDRPVLSHNFILRLGYDPITAIGYWWRVKSSVKTLSLNLAF